MSYEKFYPGGWQSGESGGTPITPEALNHIENGIKQTYSDFAPAGYGLGDVAPTLWSGSVTDIAKSGWYWYQDSTASGGPYHEGVILASIGPYHSRLDFFVLHANEYNGCHAVRVKNWNGWQEWEWENPPMIPCVEYRTTKRHNGMPVYTMAVDCGNMPSGDTHKSVEVYCYHTGWVHPVSCIGKTSIGTTIPIKFVDGNEQWIGATKGNYEGHINIDMYGGVANWTATATVEYVKL